MMMKYVWALFFLGLGGFFSWAIYTGELTGSSSSSRRGRMLHEIFVWLTDTLGQTGAAALVAGIGILIAALILMQSSGDDEEEA